MAHEIERKFLVSSDAWRSVVTSSSVIRQGYLSSAAKATVRVRIVNDTRAFITLKGKPIGLVRKEFEYELPLDDARELLEMSRPNVVEKTRHLVTHAGLAWEVDVFEGAHEGLVLAEVELDHPDRHVPLPDWIGREVSDDDRYANASLSRTQGVPTS